MRLIYTLIFCISIGFLNDIHSQDFNQVIEEFHLQLKKENTNLEQRFQLLDTLAILTENDNFHPLYEEVATECVQLGLQLQKYERTAYQTISILYYYNNIAVSPAKGIPYAATILEYKDSIPSNFKIGLLHQYRGDAYYFTNQNNLAIEDYDLSEIYFEKGKPPYDRMIALTRFYRAGALSKKGEFVKATSDMQNAIEFLETTTDTFNIVAARNELSILFSNYRFYDKAEEQRQEIIKLETSTKDQLAAIYIKKANDAYEQNNFLAYEQNMFEALDFAKASDRPHLSEPFILLNLAEKYYANQKVDLAEKYANQFFNSDYNKKDFFQNELRLFYIAKLISEKKISAAKDSLEINLIKLKPTEDVKAIYQTQDRLAKLYAQLNQFEKAYQYELAAKQLRDSIETDQKLKSLAYYQTQFETERKEKELQAAEATLELVALQSKNNTRLFYISIVALFFASIGVFIYRNRLRLKKEKQLQLQFAQDLIQAQDQERVNISSNLHDSLGQSLVLLKKQARKTQDQDLVESVSYALEELRTISRNIYPPVLKKLGLSYTLEQLTKQVFKTTAIQFDLSLANIENVITAEESLSLYRFIQEALSNTIKHAEATRIEIAIKRLESKIEVLVKDNGKGFKVEEKLNQNKSLGLLTLRHRVEAMYGTLSIQSNTEGTTVKATIPLSKTPLS